jgi:hypothetical protein
VTENEFCCGALLPSPCCRDTLRFLSDAAGRFLVVGVTIRAENWILVEQKINMFKGKLNDEKTKR